MDGGEVMEEEGMRDDKETIVVERRRRGRVEV